MGFFDSKSKSTTRREYTYTDPNKYWGQQGAANQSIDYLLKLAREARNPLQSPLYAQLSQRLSDQYSSANKQLMSSLMGRGTAFSGQARQSAAEVATARNKALADLMMQIRMQGQSAAGQAGSLANQAYHTPLTSSITEMSKSTQGMSGFDKLMGIVNLLSKAGSGIATAGLF